MAAPADDNKTEDPSAPSYKIEDLYDIKKERELLSLYLDIALEPEGGDWTKHKTKNRKLFVDYKYLPNDNLCTIRGQTDIENASVEQYYSFSEGGYNDVYEWEKQCDTMCTENVCVKSIDIDHEVVYGSYDSGLFVISPRDFCYIKARYKVNDYKGKDGKLYDISCTLCYSVDDKYPFYRSTKTKHVRAILKYSGYVFIRNKSDKNEESIHSNSCRACYIVYLDPCGWIPTWVVNLVAPDQGMVIKAMLENWSKVQPLLEKRKENGYKKDNEFMFDAPQKYEAIQEIEENKEEKEENKEEDAKIVGGWKEAEKEELNKVANAVKDKVEKEAKVNGTDIKCYKVMNGTKQVVVGMNYKINIKIDDDKYCEIWIYQSLPPIKYQLKNVEFVSDNKAGGWIKAENEEVFEVANAIKDKVEEYAKKDEQDQFKIFEPVNGTKQVVAGMNFKIKVKVGDDRFVQILVYRSLPPFNYELKNVDYL